MFPELLLIGKRFALYGIPLRVALVAIGILTGYIVIPTFIQLLM